MDSTPMLTTVDNPYNPFVDFTQWYMYDSLHGYDSCGRIARIVNDMNDVSSAVDEDKLDEAINSIVFSDVTGLYKKITLKSFDNSVDSVENSVDSVENSVDSSEKPENSEVRENSVEEPENS